MKKDSAKKIDALCSDWNRLVDGDDVATPFQTFEWNKAWWEAYGNDYTFGIQTDSSNNLNWISPLILRPEKRNFFTENTAHILGVTNSATDFGSIFIGAPADYQEAASDLLRKSSAPTVFQLRNI